MKRGRYIITVLICTLLYIVLACAPCIASGLSVLCYHQIAPDADNDMTTTPALFESQMKYLHDHGYTPVSVEEAVLFLKGSRISAARPVLITFDDGYDGIYRYAFPVLKRYKYPAIVFLVVSKITDSGTSHHLTWRQLDEMSKSGLLQAGSHTYSLHVRIPEEIASGTVTAEKLSKDLALSRQSIKKHLGTDTHYFAWPYGHYDDRTLAIAEKAGFTAIFTTDYGANHAGDGSLKIRRIRLSSVYDTVDRLKEKLEQFQ